MQTKSKGNEYQSLKTEVRRYSGISSGELRDDKVKDAFVGPRGEPILPTTTLKLPSNGPQALAEINGSDENGFGDDCRVMSCGQPQGRDSEGTASSGAGFAAA